MPQEDFDGIGFMEDISFKDEDSVYDWEDGEDSTNLVWDEDEDDE